MTDSSSSTLPLAYRSAATEVEECGPVEISREEYAHLQRAELILRHIENPDGADIFEDWHRGRRRWEVVLYQYDGEFMGYGKTLQGAVEDALDLAPVVKFIPEPVRVPWKRWTVFGAALTLGIQWLLSFL